MHDNTNSIVRALTIFGAILLIGSSAALGAYYGYTVGSHAHPLVGVVFAAAALGGELLKPFAVARALDFLRSREFLRAVAAASLATVCIIYSVTSELSLASGGRNDLASQRQASADAYERASDRRAQLAAELAAVAPARSAAELEPLVSKLLNTTGTNGCKAAPERREAKKACADIATLRSEIGRANRRADLQAQLNEFDERIGSAPVVAPGGDPLAVSLSAYASALGVSASADSILPWLALVPVLFLELGSALALVALGGTQAQVSTVVKPGKEKPSAGKRTPPAQRKDSQPPPSETALLNHLKMNGGTASGGQRAIAKSVGLSKTRLNEVLRDLADAGRIVVATSAAGTNVKLAGA